MGTEDFDFGIGDAASTARLHDATQAAITAAKDRVIAVVGKIGNSPTTTTDDKIYQIGVFADCGDALLKGQTPNLQPASPATGSAPAGLAAAPTPASTTSNTADVQRIAELETALKDAATAAGVTTFPLTSGKIDAKRLVADIDSAIKAKVASSAKPAIPADMVKKDELTGYAATLRTELAKKLPGFKSGPVGNVDAIKALEGIEAKIKK